MADSVKPADIWHDQRETKKFGPSHIEFSRENHNADTQRLLAFSIFDLVSVLSLFLIAGVAVGWWKTTDVNDIAALILGPIVAIFGTVVGFYYGANKK